MTAYAPAKGVPRKGMRQQLRGERKHIKTVKTARRVR